jgi:hypothetical protein
MADLNALIAQGYQPQAPVDPFAQYAKMQQLNVGQNQNALAQYQLAQAQRADVQANALNAAYASGINPDTGEMDYAKVRRSLAVGGAGSQIPALEKSRLEQQKSLYEQQELLGKIAKQPVELARAKLELVDQQLKQSKERLNQIDPNNPDAGEQLLAWHQSNHQGLLGDTLRASGSTPEQTQGAIQAAVAKGPAGIADFIQKSTLGQTEFAKSIAPTPKRVTDGKTSFLVDDNPRSPTFGQKVGGAGFEMGMTPGEKSTAAIAASRLAFDQQKFAWEKANPGHELIQNADGEYYAVDKRTKALTPLMVGGAAPAATAPAAGVGVPAVAPAGGVPVGRTAPAAGVPFVGKTSGMTESQGNATAFGMRMKDSHTALKNLENKGMTNTGVIGSTIGGVVGLVPLIGDKLASGVDNIYNVLPQVLGGYSPEQQQVLNGRINFITAVLRKESGASINPNEFTTMEKLYFPRPGDDASLIKQKQNARELAIKAMKVQAGPGAKSIDQLEVGGSAASANDPLGLR